MKKYSKSGKITKLAKKYLYTAQIFRIKKKYNSGLNEKISMPELIKYAQLCLMESLAPLWETN